MKRVCTRLAGWFWTYCMPTGASTDAAQTRSLPMEIRVLPVEKLQGRWDLLPCRRRSRSPMGKAARVGDRRAPGPGRRRFGQVASRLRSRASSIPGSTRAEVRPSVYFWSYQAAGCSEQEPTAVPPIRTHAIKLCAIYPVDCRDGPWRGTRLSKCARGGLEPDARGRGPSGSSHERSWWLE